MINTIAIDDLADYGRSLYTPTELKIATLPTGYADGNSWELSSNDYVYIKGKKAPVVGWVCMDQMMVNKTAMEDVCQGDVVVLLGDS